MHLITPLHAQARKNLELVRGTKNVDVEFAAITEAAELAKLCPHPWYALLPASLISPTRDLLEKLLIFPKSASEMLQLLATTYIFAKSLQNTI